MSFRPKKKKEKGKAKPTNGSELDLQLFHGDIVVMHGTEIHRCYEVRSTVNILSRLQPWMLMNNSIESSLTESVVSLSRAGI